MNIDYHKKMYGFSISYEVQELSEEDVNDIRNMLKSAVEEIKYMYQCEQERKYPVELKSGA